jgi:preprotein translocase subunit SecF
MLELVTGAIVFILVSVMTIGLITDCYKCIMIAVGIIISIALCVIFGFSVLLMLEGINLLTS